jgi:hypothetical protein
VSIPVAEGFVDRFGLFPGSVWATAGKGSGSGLDRRSTRAAGLVLTPIPCGAESVRRERLWVLWGWPCSPMSKMDGKAEPGSRLPVIPSPPAWGGMECYGRSQAESIKIDRPRRGGGQTQSDLASGCAGLEPHAVGARQRM